MIHAILYTALFAACSGFVEALWIHDRISKGDKRKLPHTLLVWIRGFVIVGIMWFTIGMHGFFHEAVTLLSLGLVFAPIHRFILNLFGHEPWYYMGPTNRVKGDSDYDTLWMMLSAEKITTKTTQEWTITQYTLIRPWLPFLLCTAFETLCAVGMFWLNSFIK